MIFKNRKLGHPGPVDTLLESKPDVRLVVLEAAEFIRLMPPELAK